MDVLRAALGDPKLYFLGKSYGTSLGATYAEQFPDKVGRFVLDGAIDPRVNSLEAARTQAAGFELALDAFLTDCVARSDCPLGTDKKAARQRLAALLKRTDSNPLPGDGTRTVNEPLATIGVIAALYDKQTWPLLRQALTQANAGNGQLLLLFADSYFQRDEKGNYDNTMAANAAINCLDSPPAAQTIEDVEKQKDAFREASPIFGETLAWAGLSCTHWPVPAVDKPREIKAAGAAPILVVGTTRDPATPYSWAEGLTSQLDSGVLLTYEGDGHTAYMRGEGTSCIDDAVDAYLIDGRVPEDGTRCR
jgi:pimeloyl-ACP methyl ester carboxylesterase